MCACYAFIRQRNLTFFSAGNFPYCHCVTVACHPNSLFIIFVTCLCYFKPRSQRRIVDRWTCTEAWTWIHVRFLYLRMHVCIVIAMAHPLIQAITGTIRYTTRRTKTENISTDAAASKSHYLQLPWKDLICDSRWWVRALTLCVFNSINWLYMDKIRMFRNSIFPHYYPVTAK